MQHARSAGDRPRGGRFHLLEGRERKRRTKAVRPVPYQCLRGRVEKREADTGRAPGLPPERLLNCVSTPSRRAPRLMEPARGVPPIAGALPAAARQWRRAILGRGRSRLPSSAVVCGLGLVRAPILAALGPQFCSGAFVSGLCFVCASFFFCFFFFFFCSAVLLPGGSQEARRRQRGAPTGQRVSAPGARAAGKRRRRRDAGVPGGPLGPDEREVEE